MSGKRVVIVGGGFGGLFTALNLETRSDLTLLNREDHFLFTPLLYEYLSGEVEQWHLAPKYTELLDPRVQLVHGDATAIDLITRRIYVTHRAPAIEYDALVLALGGVSNYWSIPGAEQFALPFRKLADADALRARMTEVLDEIPANANADDVRDAATFIIVGAGASGCELSTKMADLAREALQRRNLPGSARIVLLEMGQQVVPEMGEGIRPYVEDALREKRVEVHTSTRVLEVKSHGVVTDSAGARAEFLSAATVWTAGVRVNPLLDKLNLPREHRGLLLVEPTLQVRGHPEIFAVGDNAYIDNVPQRLRGTAQLAVQQAALAAENVDAFLEGRPLRTREFIEHGEAVSLGTERAAFVAGERVYGGALARQARFAMYTTRLPTWHHRLRVGASWFFEGTAHEPLEVHS